MRKDSLEIISNYLFRGSEAKISLAEDEREMLLRIETCYTKWLDDPMQSDIEMRNFIMNEFNVGRQTALKILNYTIYALGNVNSAAKSFVRKKIDFLLTKAAAVAEAGDLKYAQTLTKIALAYGKAFDTGTDDMTDFLFGSFYKSRTCSHTDDNGMVKSGKEKTALSRREEFLDTYSRDAQEVSCRERRSDSSDLQFFNIGDLQLIRVHELSERTESRSDRIVRLDDLIADDLVTVHTYYFRGTSAYIQSDDDAHTDSPSLSCRDL